VIERIDAIKSGRQESWSRTGNQYVLTLRSDQAILEDIYPADSAEKPVTIALSEFEDAVSLWLEALKSLRRDR
jgi:hypothetical protein